MHLTGLKDNSRGRCVLKLARLSQQRPQLVTDIEMPKEVYTEMTDQKVKTIKGFTEPAKDLPDLREVSKITFFPVNISVLLLVLDGFDGAGALLFFAVHHDDFAASVGEGAADFIANSEGAAGDDGDAALEVFWLDDLRADACCFLEDGLHGVLLLVMWFLIAES
ncbi:hypothetical protein HG530_007129 [Fusarium avenaceum]|nr:hypothetical protein HG530_007129 [Fusarium avenaceum]